MFLCVYALSFFYYRTHNRRTFILFEHLGPRLSGHVVQIAFYLYKLPVSPKLGDTILAECRASNPATLFEHQQRLHVFRLIFILHMYTYIWPWLS